MSPNMFIDHILRIYKKCTTGAWQDERKTRESHITEAPSSLTTFNFPPNIILWLPLRIYRSMNQVIINYLNTSITPKTDVCVPWVSNSRAATWMPVRLASGLSLLKMSIKYNVFKNNFHILHYIFLNQLYVPCDWVQKVEVHVL